MVVIRDGRIDAIADAEPEGSHRTLDLAGKYLLPGLIDSHVHVGSSGQARKALRSGITTLDEHFAAHAPTTVIAAVCTSMARNVLATRLFMMVGLAPFSTRIPVDTASPETRPRPRDCRGPWYRRPR